jgi:hypothetical protein
MPTILDLHGWLDDVTMAEYFVHDGVKPLPPHLAGNQPKLWEKQKKQNVERLTPMTFSTTV